MRHFLILTCLLFVTASYAEEGDYDFKGLVAKKALRDYKKAVAKDEEAQAQKQKELDETGAKAAKKTRDAFVESLKKALKQSMQSGNLEEANKIDAAIKALKKRAEQKEKAETKRPTKVTYWPSGKKYSEVRYRNGEREGLATSWHKNGQKQYEGYYKNGEPDGLWTAWDENGQKREERHFKNGKKHGLWTAWHENGQKSSETHYKNGEQVSRKEF